MRFLIGLGASLLALSSSAAPLGQLAQVVVIDRDSGTTLSTYYHQGEYWIAGRPGARYAVEIRNSTGERLMAVVSVDGINVITGATAAFDQAGYVFDPYDQYRITGWRKSDAEVAAFTFTDSRASYAQRTGRPENVGVIGVAVFRERVAPPVPMSEAPLADGSARREPPPPPPMTAPPPAAQPQGGSALRRSLPDVAGRLTGDARASEARPEPKLGTGHGERETSRVTHTHFERLQSTPNEVIRIHYDSLPNLIAMGVLPPPAAPNPFPGSQYVPDPPDSQP